MQKSSGIYRRLRYLCLLIGLLACAVLLLLTPQRVQHGWTRIHNNTGDYERRSNWLWPTISGHSFSEDDGLSQVTQVRFEGYLWQGTAGSTRWHITHTGGLQIWLDGAQILNLPEKRPNETITLDVSWQSAAPQILIEKQVDINTPRDDYALTTDFAIYEENAFGMQALLPTQRMYATPPDAATANRALLQAQATTILKVLLVASALASGILWLLEKRIWRVRGAWLIMGLLLLTLLLRLILMSDRAASDPFFYFLVPAGDDNYLLWGQQWLSGAYDLAGTFWPPAPILWFAGIVWLAGPQIENIYFANIIISVLACGAVMAAAWHLTQRWRVVGLAGLLYALYPPLIFYQATTQSIVLDTALAAGALYAGLAAIQRGSWRYAALFGVMIGLGGLSRGTALLLGPAFFLALLLRHQATGLRLTIIAACTSLLMLAPQILLTGVVTGNWSLVPYSNGSLTLYSGNNRDADGIWTGRGMAWELERLTERDWTGAFAEDLQRDPLRIVELNLRKLGMFWNRYEYVSNVNYRQQGLDNSVLLRMLSVNDTINMATFSFFAWVGMVLLFKRDRAASFVNLGILALVLGTVAFVIAGRLRAPLLPFLIVAAATAFDTIWLAIHQRKTTRRLLIALGIACGLSVLFPLLDQNLPRERSATLPANVIPTTQPYNDNITLLGHDPIETDYESYLYVTLYWEVLQTPPEDYTLFIELIDERTQTRITGLDRDLGSVSYPPQGTSTLNAGHIIREGYLLQLPDDAPPSLRVDAGLYVDPEARIGTSTLMTLGLRDQIPQECTVDLPGGVADYSYPNGLAIYENNLTQAGDVLTVTGNWRTPQQLYRDWVIFVHVLDAQNRIVAQLDGENICGDLTISAMIPGSVYAMKRSIDISHLAAATYTVATGIYDRETLQRLSFNNTADTSIEVGQFALEGD